MMHIDGHECHILFIIHICRFLPKQIQLKLQMPINYYTLLKLAHFHLPHNHRWKTNGIDPKRLSTNENNAKAQQSFHI